MSSQSQSTRASQTGSTSVTNVVSSACCDALSDVLDEDASTAANYHVLGS